MLFILLAGWWGRKGNRTEAVLLTFITGRKSAKIPHLSEGTFAVCPCITGNGQNVGIYGVVQQGHFTGGVERHLVVAVAGFAIHSIQVPLFLRRGYHGGGGGRGGRGLYRGDDSRSDVVRGTY